MTQLTLNDDQVAAIRQSAGGVELCDRSGAVVGYATPRAIATPEEIAEAHRRLASNEPCYTTAEVLDYLRSLEQA